MVEAGGAGLFQLFAGEYIHRRGAGQCRGIVTAGAEGDDPVEGRRRRLAGRYRGIGLGVLHGIFHRVGAGGAQQTGQWSDDQRLK